MLADSKLATTFSAKAVNTACYVQNRVLVIKPHNKTPYELFLGRKPSLGFMRPFGCPVTILNTIDHLGKFDGKADEGFFIGYSTNSKAFKVFNSRTRIVEESLHVKFNENTPNIAGSGHNWLFDIDALTKTMNYQPIITGNQTNGSAGTQASYDAGNSREKTNSPDDGDAEKQDNDDPREESGNDDQEKEDDVNSTNIVNAASTNEVNVVGAKTSIELPNDPNMPPLEEIVFSDDDEEVGAGADITNLDTNIPVSLIQTTRIHKDHPLDQVIRDVHSATQTRRMTKNWIEAMQEELLQFKLQKVWTLVDLPKGKRAIGTKWVNKNKKDERGIVVRNKARLMDVKSAFLYDTIEEDVYVYQPSGFEDPEFPNKVYKVEKALYGLHQALRACQDKYVADILKKFDFSTVKTASTPMETNKALLKDSKADDFDVYLYRSMIGSLMYLTTLRPDIMFAVCVCARFQVIPKVSHLQAVKRIFRYLKGQPKLGLWYPKDSPLDLEAYSDSDYAGASLDRKSTTRGCQFFGKRLVSWQCKKQTVVANSTTEAEYVAAANCYGQWIIHKGWLEWNATAVKDGIGVNTDMDERSGQPTDSQHTYTSAQPSNKEQTTISSIQHKKTYTHRKLKNVTKIPQLSEPTNLVEYEAVYEEMYDRVERATTTATSLDAE
ncbi:putative ribonuclease H-like domain-containing protein [Tanacetum coccineum]